MPEPVITAGDDVQLTAYLYDNGTAVDCSTGTIRAALQDGRGRALVSSTAQSSGTTGANWSQGVVVCVFPASATTGLQRGDAYLEVELTTGAGLKRTWPLMPVTVQRPSIT